MSLLALILVLIAIGLVVWAATTYLPLPSEFKSIIRIVGICIAVWLLLEAFGVIDYVRQVRVPRFG